mgnify:CR=1 FL=1
MMELTEDIYAHAIDDWYDGLNDVHDHNITELVYEYLDSIEEFHHDY